MNCVATLSGEHTNTIYSLELMPDGTILSGATDNLVVVWDPKTPKKLISFNPLNAGVYSIQLVSQDQVVAIAGLTNKIVFYRINGSSIPILVKNVALPPFNYVYSMITFNVMYNNVNSFILYTAGPSSQAASINVTSMLTISLINTVTVDTKNTLLFAVEKSS